MPIPLGIYLHIPFCETKCHYCHFASGVYPDRMVPSYLKAMKNEILLLRGVFERLVIPFDLLDNYSVDTVYFGGGTPSLIEGSAVVELIGLLRDVFEFSCSTEITLEVNPGSANPSKIEQYQRAGVNRISIGAQAFQNELLERIGRSHTVEETLGTVELFRSMGIQNVSLDLIGGLPGQNQRDWHESLETIQRLSPEHVSMYLLEIHDGTRFGRTYGAAGQDEDFSQGPNYPGLPDEEFVEWCYFEAVHQFERFGYHHYELSNFARRGYESRHNLKYWTDQPFIGFGCSAHSYFDGKRWGNQRSIGRYIELIESEGHAIDFYREATGLDRQEEAVFLGLRLTQGIDLFQFEEKFGFDLRDRVKAKIDYLEEAQLLECDQNNLRLTPKGYILSNEVFSELLR